jgi:hypothetical protein
MINHFASLFTFEWMPRSQLVSSSQAFSQAFLLWYEYLHHEQLKPTDSLPENPILEGKDLPQLLHLPCERKNVYILS